MRSLTAVTLLCALLSVACEGAGEDRILSVRATGTIQGLIYFDANGNRMRDAADVLLPGVGVRLVLQATGDTVARATSGTDGTYEMSGVAVGEYGIVLDSASVGDSARVVLVEAAGRRITERDSSPATLTLGASRRDTVTFAVSFPKLTVAEARLLPPGRKLFVEGLALNDRGTFGDTTVHLADSSGALRATKVGANVLAGDSLRLRGTASVRDGQPALDEVTAFVVSSRVRTPSPQTVTADAAATAGGGLLDAALVKVSNVAIQDTSTVADAFRMQVSDGFGLLEVLLDRDVGFRLGPYIPGAVVDATGLLVPAGPGRWRLKPRAEADVVFK